MKHYARVIDGLVSEAPVSLPDEIRLEDVFHPDVVAAFVPCGEEVREGWRKEGDVFVEPPPPPPEPLDPIKLNLCAAIDAAAERERLKWITGGAGQAMTYQMKAAEAERLASDADPALAAYPLLSAEIGITADDLAGVGAVVRAQHAAWLMAGAAIEAARLGGKKAVNQAASAEAAQQAFDAVTWPQPII